MANKREQDKSDDTSFEALLKQVARASAPTLRAKRASGSHRLDAGTHLLDGRMHIKRQVGYGGMGVVYEAYDQLRGESVALKTLSLLDPDGVYRIKNEFRTLADVRHPNLCRFHELFSDDAEWFFTMELVHGQRFDKWVRPDGELDEVRFRPALSQLYDGIVAIHGAGKLHRDLKPSNVMVTGDGRVVLLDFGLAVDRDPGGAGQTVLDAGVSGTPGYMAPEQAAGHAASAASDFYAFGIMLFEALTGKLPFVGPVGAMLAAKQSQPAPSVSSLAPTVSGELWALCDALLSRNQRERPDAEAVAEALGASPVRRPSTMPSVSPGPRPRPSIDLLGRDDELRALRDAYDQTVADQAVAVFISGESGMGKSALVSAFLDELRQSDRAVVLSGRCYERENVPFKAFDALVDDLSRHLRRLPREQAIALMPRDVFAMAQVFPALARVPVVAEAPKKPIQDPQELRRRAFRAFSELLARIRDRKPLCIHVDDLQWIDRDSVIFLRAVLVDREPAPMLMLATHRAEGAQHNELLSEVLEVARTNSKRRLEQITIAPLETGAARALAERYLPEELVARDDVCAAIVQEAAGSPFFISELARQAARLGGAEAGLSLSTVFSTHLEDLPESARSLLELTAMMGQPLPADILLEAAGATHDALDELRARHLVQISALDRGQLLECYHDRVRESIAGPLSRQARALGYRAVGDVLLGRKNPDPELVSRCLEESDQHLLAAKYAEVAAVRAERGMAFDRATELYSRALTLGSGDGPERHARMVALADALANAGRGAEAADAYLEAAASVEGEQNIGLRRRAADELLVCGDFARGKELLSQVCASVGFRLPATKRAAFISRAKTQSRLRFSKLDVVCNSPSDSSPERRLRWDVVCSAAHSLAAHEPLTAAAMADHVLLLALQTREPAHLARALYHQAFFTTATNPRAEARIARLYALAQKYASRVDSHELDGLIALNMGSGHAYGRNIAPAEARRLVERALQLLGGCRGVRFEVDIANFLLVLLASNDLRREAAFAAQLVEESLALGRIWCASLVVGMSTVPRLATGDSAGIARQRSEVEAIWKRPNEMTWTDSALVLGAARIAHYEGKPEAGLEEIEKAWPSYERSMLSKAVLSRRDMHAYRGMLALSTARRTSEPQRRRRLRDLAAADRRRVAKVTVGPLSPLLGVLDTGLALERGEHDDAVLRLRRIVHESSQSAAEPDLLQLCARRRLGQLLTGDEGAALIDLAGAEMTQRGVTDIERTTEVAFPGCWVD